MKTRIGSACAVLLCFLFFGPPAAEVHALQGESTDCLAISAPSAPPSFQMSEVGGKAVESYPVAPFGYDVGMVQRTSGYTVTIREASGATAKVVIQDFGSHQFVSRTLGGLLRPLMVSDPSPSLALQVKTDYSCPAVENGQAEDYSGYLTVVELAGETSLGEGRFRGSAYPTYLVNVSGLDPVAGQRRFLELSSGINSADRVPIGLLPGTHISVPKGAKLLLSVGSGTQKTRWSISEGSLDIRFDRKLRISNGVKVTG